VGAACWGLKLYSDAREAYERGLNLEPDDQALQRGLEKVGGKGGGCCYRAALRA